MRSRATTSRSVSALVRRRRVELERRHDLGLRLPQLREAEGEVAVEQPHAGGERSGHDLYTAAYQPVHSSMYRPSGESMSFMRSTRS